MDRLVFLFVLLASGACASALTKADRAFERGDYERAAEMYEQLPSRPADATDRMQEARRRALANRIERFERSRANPDEALEQLSVVLARKSAWPLEAAAYSARLDAGVQWGSARVAADIDASLAIHRPRAAEQLLAKRSRYLQSSEFTKLRRDLKARIHAEATTRCSALETELTSPYLRRFAAAYCRRFDVPWTHESPLPFTVARFDVDNRVDGLTPPQSERLVARLNEALRTTAWYSPSAPEIGRAHVEGKVAADFHVANVVMSADYTETVPYTDTESYQDPYQEAYSDTEYYTQQVPHTVYGTESYSCGSYNSPQTCTRSTSRTEYRSESRTRQVTRYRTAYQTKWRTVTRYHHVPRTHEYDAREHRGYYFASWRIGLEGKDWPSALSLQSQRADSQTRVSHDETFEPAELYPSHPKLRSQAQWAEQEIDALTDQLINKLTAGWTKAYCVQPSFSPEEAARCVYGDGDDAPVLAKNVLRAAFDGDVIEFDVRHSK